ncbi:MAG: ISAs1-like element ISCbu1 family transposase [Synechococcales cyanobacterium]
MSDLNHAALQESILIHFGNITDPRVKARSRHNLLNIIVIALFAVLCGADGWIGVETYGKAKQDWLSTFLDLSEGIPSHDTFGRVFSILNPEELEQSFQGWVRLIAQKLGLNVIAIDGKSMKGSYDRESSLEALQMVSAWSSVHGLVLGQCAVEKKSNEIRAIPVLLEQLDLKGAIITIDAMGTQKSISQLIQKSEADYILALKANHPTLNNVAKEWFREHREALVTMTEIISSSSTEGGHHRIEKRQFWQIPVERVFSHDSIKEWSGLKTLVIEESHRTLWNGDTCANRFFLSSLPTDYAEFSNNIRSHWGIENQLHWCLDVIFKEDDSRLREGHAPRNMSVLRRMSLNLLRREPSRTSLKMKRYKAGLDNNYLLKILS